MISDIFFSQKNIDRIYKVNDVTIGFRYWFWKLFNVLQEMFVYQGLPDALPAREIEINLLLTGHCIIFEHDFDVITANTNIFGYDRYYRPIKATYANPVIGSDTLTIGDDCEIIYNNSLMDNVSYIPCDASLNTFIARYARQLADIEATINIDMVNNRIISFPVASNDGVMQSLKSFFKKWRNGESSIITDDNIIQEFRNVDIAAKQTKNGINDWLIARDKILEQFFREIGVKMYQPKKAQVSEDEVTANNQLLLISHDDMLKCRQDGIKRINDHYGLNITVSLNDKFNVTNDGVPDVGGEQNDGMEV